MALTRRESLIAMGAMGAALVAPAMGKMARRLLTRGAQVPTGTYKVYYWAAGSRFLGRLPGILAILEHAGADYELVDNKQWNGPPIFACPIVETPAGAAVSQSAAIMATLGAELGLAPSEPAAAARALQMSCDAVDFLDQGFKFSFDEPARAQKWMAHLDALVKEDQPLHYAHFQLWQAVFLLTQHHGGTLPGGISDDVAAWVAKMEALKGCKAVLEINKKIPTAPPGGV